MSYSKRLSESGPSPLVFMLPSHGLLMKYDHTLCQQAHRDELIRSCLPFVHSTHHAELESIISSRKAFYFQTF